MNGGALVPARDAPAMARPGRRRPSQPVCSRHQFGGLRRELVGSRRPFVTNGLAGELGAAWAGASGADELAGVHRECQALSCAAEPSSRAAAKLEARIPGCGGA